MFSPPTTSAPLAALSPALRERLRRVKLLAVDVDGTLTDAGIYLGENGEVVKRWNSRDGYGIHLAVTHGLRVAFVTGRQSPLVTARAAELHVDEVYLGCEDKPAAVRELAEKHGLGLDEIAFVGDDLPDATTFALVGVGIAVGDATDATRAAADYVTQHPGGHGAVREVIELIFHAQGRWENLVETILGGTPS